MKTGEKFSQRLRRLRKLRKLSAKEVAAGAEVPESTYREWEYGRQVKGEPYVKLAEVLKVSLSELIAGVKPDHDDLLRHVEVIEAELAALKRKLGLLP